MLNATQAATRLDVPAFADLTDYATPNTLISYARVYARRIQYESGSDLPMMIQGLRTMDACQAPWIATSYCWLDLDRHIEMANSLARQNRCNAQYRTNGAVYLESILRNVDWPTFESCWGTSFEIGVARDVPSLKPNGAAWLTSLTTLDRLSVVGEANFWHSMGLLTYTTQWQNFKALGLRDVFSIENAFGLRYDMTLQSNNGSYHIPMSTSWKTYWTFASDLWAISTNGSGIAGKSLLRQSPHFAFANASLASILTRNITLQAPLDDVLSEFHHRLGPFGAVDLYHVSFPASLAQLQRDIRSELSTLLSSSKSNAMQDDYASLVLMYSMSPVPRVLDRSTYLCAGGSLFCGQIPSNFNFSIGLSLFTGVDTMCYTSFNEWVFVNQMQAVFSVVASGIALDPTNLIPLACAAEVIAPAQCLAFLASVSNFVSTYFPTSSLQAYRSRATFVEADVIATSVAHGDVHSVAMLSTQSPMSRFAASSIEMPLNVATYLRGLCQYVSFVLAAIALVAGFYTLANGCTSEGYNLFEVNRVGGLTWIGRPLLLVRSVTALCILSTATLQLHKNGITTQMIASREDVSSVANYVIKILAASELGWLVYIFDDVCMAWTRQYSASYTAKTATTAWLVAVGLSFTSPVSHSATIQRSCEIVEMDFEMVCHSGVVAIGSVDRFQLLVGIAVGGSILMYVLDRAWHVLPPLNERDSCLVSCSAKYLFERRGWVYDRVYYLDFASAALTGLLVCTFQGDYYVFDIKTWRMLVIRRSDIQAAMTLHPSAHHLARALPLLSSS
ncbi:hypothetical protein SPRG_22344 [Saprolegnia parasitica CBS 223.65]|uniref:Uncharacterized protein n=1 Tax=Saprolegnia parasitica (strain CBS 223.65) TaxID=695850 RepID=A0A067BSU9_SAPPC|nr:hypothetical protein SPRG_22344 [Saprolegnia parasitica CBS 223.65]KDO19910.1 hypothetical protein SPRG_22344 [Saprolegnia parasitica CBS 223.65]|eukprot:XP_012209380.1 hypothetical protein SPRG_22344 [Saprolegnia parasitica CBS 223.65]